MALCTGTLTNEQSCDMGLATWPSPTRPRRTQTSTVGSLCSPYAFTVRGGHLSFRGLGVRAALPMAGTELAESDVTPGSAF